jgi:2-hydroxy-3-oxopropionate reductase
MSQPVGFIGLGLMGRPMASNLMRAGFPLVLHSRTRQKADDLAREGEAVVVDSPAEVAERCEVVITMLPDTPDVEHVVAGREGVLAGIRADGLLIDMSTISPVVTRHLAARLAERGASMLDAPVSGGDVGAIQGTLSIMVGGEERDFRRARPLFEAMGRTIVHMGPNGAGQVTKAANQIVVAGTIAAVSEALVLGARAGVDPGRILDVLGGGLAGNKVMEVKREKFLKHAFEPGFRAELHHKDLGIALATARAFDVALPVTALLDQLFVALKQLGGGGEDHSALLRVIEELSGFVVGSGEPDGRTREVS